MHDRSSRPHRLRQPTSQAIVEEIERLRRQRWTGKQIAAKTGVSPATVSRVLRRLGLNKLSALEPAEPVRRYEREKPGELIHIDIKKLGRIGSVGHRITGRYRGAVNRHHGIGWEFVHVCIDDASRVASVGLDRRPQSPQDHRQPIGFQPAHAISLKELLVQRPHGRSRHARSSVN